MGLIDDLKRVVVTRDLDLSELDEVYVDEAGRPLLLNVRVNWTRRMKTEMAELSVEAMEANREASKLSAAVEDMDEAEAAAADEALAKRINANVDRWYGWFARVLLIDTDEVQQLQENLPSEHWSWLIRRVKEIANEYERETVKKAGGGLSPTSEEPDITHPLS